MTKETKEVNFIETEEHLKIVEAVKPHLSIEKGEVKFDRDEAVKAAFEVVETTEKEVKTAYKKTTAVNNAIRRVFGELAIEDMAKNKEVNEVATKFSVAGETVSLTTRRNDETRNPSTGEVTPVQGATTIRRSVKGSVKQNTSIGDHLKAIGAKKLA